jgi:hypothetical protein
MQPQFHMLVGSRSKVRVQIKLSQQALAYFGFHPPRPLIHPPSRTGDATQRDFLFVPGTIYRCTNAQTPPCISCDVAMYLISLVPYDPPEFDGKLGFALPFQLSLH